MSIPSPDYPISGGVGGRVGEIGLGFPPQQTTQSFADPYHIDNTNSRRLPFPPHTGQYYQSPLPLGNDDDEGIREDMRLERGMMRVFDEPEHVVIDHDDDRNTTSILPVPVPLSLPHSLSPSQPHISMTHHQEILSPQPRFFGPLGGRESPTKMLEEKLEALLEPRPRSRVVSRVVSSSGGKGNESRPRSRVASMNLNGSLNGSLRGKKGGNGSSRVGTPVNGSLRNEGDDGGDNKLEDTTQQQQQQQQPRTRVVSISSRNHSHRLSGWKCGERRSGIPFNEEEVDGFVINDHPTTTTDKVKEEEEENVSSSEDGEIGNIDAVLEKSESVLTKEPKSSVITVLERGPLRVEENEEEESVEALLEKEENRVGGEAWESVGEVETVKRVGGEEEKKVGIEDVFAGNDDLMTLTGGGGGGLNEMGYTLGIGKNMRLRKKARKSDDVKAPPPLPTMTTTTANATTMTDEVDDRDDDEIEVLREKVKEMREMVEDVRGRLGNVEMWIEGQERRVENKREEDKVQRSNGNQGASSSSTTTIDIGEKDEEMGIECVVVCGVGWDWDVYGCVEDVGEETGRRWGIWSGEDGWAWGYDE
ncbi:hypothetical protein AGABI1DRAFT_107731 [Agaricus bisporus var. burnettii JB137-S8]|uniref:Uncharacterized protein n=1 Tax=Agaricus bisporus var. burnettii (strain JB137-S8 / ATCC MYA-4627 / FGSC 10392) TaxID=597362 RepID=K5X433_AGABU|nr:uncharacterized protein AGABI1DRAFT_107731 [Agaricus bisporus var. burnettii JB137-S8]EKM77943.1 hypothetical protein AGABI1DRAFT_107731 [Agaricus bisporus var. burnettii JB137-S8]